MTDVAGFTEIMRTNEPQALPLLRADLEVIRAHVSRQGGDVVKVAGDGVLALFSSAASAVRACIDAQKELGGSTLKHRMAIHAGEVTITEGDAYGDAVNVCSRLETIATPGNVTASRIVIDLIKSQGLPNPVKKGSVNLKGIAHPVEVFSWGEEAARRINPARIFAGVGIGLALIVTVSVLLSIKKSQAPLPDTVDRRTNIPMFVPRQVGARERFFTQAHEDAQNAQESGNQETEAEEMLNQAFDEIWEELEAYDNVKEMAIKNVDAKIAMTWLKAHPMGQTERGKRELEHWGLVNLAIEKGKAIVGPNANAKAIEDALKTQSDEEVSLAAKAFADEFKEQK